MNPTIELNDVLEFVKKQRLMSIATISPEARPEASVVEFGEMDDFTIIIDTLKTSRKYKNFQTNSDAAVVIGWDEDITVQLEGVVHELVGGELEIAKEAYFAKNQRAKKWASRPEIAYFAIKPNWIRYSDLRQWPWYVRELNVDKGAQA